MGEETNDIRYVVPENFQTWTVHILRMRLEVAIWDALNAGNWDDLRRQLGAKEHRPAPDALANHAVQFLLVSVGHRVGQLLLPQIPVDADRTRPEIPVDPPLRFHFQPDSQVPGVATVGGWNSDAERPFLKIVPRNLLQAMYLQFAHSILGGKVYKRCEACRKWFELTPGINRADRTTCTASCRFKMYRQRRRRALELHAKGWTARKIAKEIGSAVETVKQWITNQE